ncbi:MAG: PilZ domain-containing protein [bacterium]
MKGHNKEPNHDQKVSRFLPRPGMNVVCALHIDEEAKIIDARSAMIYDCGNDMIIISQTNPVIESDMIGKKIEISYLCKDSAREGLVGVIEKIIDDYQLNSSKKVQAIILREFSKIKGYNLRFAHRVVPTKDSNVGLCTYFGDELDIVDISVLGIRFAAKREAEYKRGQEINLQLRVDDKYYDIILRIIRKETDKMIDGREVNFFGAKFININEHLRDRLFKIIRETERKRAFSHKFKRYPTE